MQQHLPSPATERERPTWQRTQKASKTPEVPKLQPIIELFFELQLTMKLRHWLTSVHSEHVAMDRVSASLSEKIDHFVEAYLGRFPEKVVSGNHPDKTSHISTMSISAFPFPPLQGGPRMFPDYIRKKRSSLEALATRLEEFKGTRDLVTIVDDILGDLNLVLYLLTLK